MLWRKGERGTIDAIPKKDAEDIYNYVRKRIRETKEELDNRHRPVSVKPDVVKESARDNQGPVCKGRDHTRGVQHDEERPG